MSGGEKEGLPSGWELATVGDVVTFNYGKALPAQARDESGFPVYGSNGVVGYHSSPQVAGPAIIIGRKGSIGEAHLSEGPCSPIDTTYFIDEFYGQPPSYWLNLLRHLDLARLDRASAVPGLNRGDAYQLKVQVPPTNEQKRIVAKIEALQARSDAAKEVLDAIPPLLEKFRQAVLAAAFRGDLTKKWREAHPDVEPASKLLERIRAERRRKWEEANPKKKYVEPEPVDTDGLPELPEGWCWASLETICRFIDYRGKTPPKSASGIPLITAKNVRPGYVDPEPREYVEQATYDEYMTRGFPRRGDVLFTTEAPMGFAALVEFTQPFALAQRIINLQPSEEIAGEFLLPYLLSPGFQILLEEKATGTTVNGIKASRLKRLPVPVAPQSEQAMLAEACRAAMAFIGEVFEVMGQVELKHDCLNQSILAKAFRGELVPQDPNDEPAAVLLERIRQERAASRDATGAMGRQRRRRDQTEGAP